MTKPKHVGRRRVLDPGRQVLVRARRHLFIRRERINGRDGRAPHVVVPRVSFGVDDPLVLVVRAQVEAPEGDARAREHRVEPRDGATGEDAPRDDEAEEREAGPVQAREPVQRRGRVRQERELPERDAPRRGRRGLAVVFGAAPEEGPRAHGEGELLGWVARCHRCAVRPVCGARGCPDGVRWVAASPDALLRRSLLIRGGTRAAIWFWQGGS